jgi:aspartate carbamoyltransferase catalytic subunit
LDFYTFDRTFRKYGRIDNKVIVICGDLLQSRTVHDLVPLFRNYRGVELRLVSHPELKMPTEVLEYLDRHNVRYVETDNLNEAVDGADGVYMTRFQKEYTDETGVALDLDLSPYYLRPEHLDHPRKVAILHPMPRGPELVAEFDEDSRVLIWRQQRNGMWVRAALLFLILWRKNYDFIFD